MRYWKKVKDGKTITVESYSHNLDIKGAIEITEAEFNQFIDSLPKPMPVPVRDLFGEIDEMKAQLKVIEPKVKLDHEDRIKKLEGSS